MGFDAQPGTGSPAPDRSAWSQKRLEENGANAATVLAAAVDWTNSRRVNETGLIRLMLVQPFDERHRVRSPRRPLEPLIHDRVRNGLHQIVNVHASPQPLSLHCDTSESVLRKGFRISLRR